MPDNCRAVALRRKPRRYISPEFVITTLVLVAGGAAVYMVCQEYVTEPRKDTVLQEAKHEAEKVVRARLGQPDQAKCLQSDPRYVDRGGVNVHGFIRVPALSMLNKMYEFSVTFSPPPCKITHVVIYEMRGREQVLLIDEH